MKKKIFLYYEYLRRFHNYEFKIKVGRKDWIYILTPVYYYSNTGWKMRFCRKIKNSIHFSLTLNHKLYVLKYHTKQRN